MIVQSTNNRRLYGAVGCGKMFAGIGTAPITSCPHEYDYLITGFTGCQVTVHTPLLHIVCCIVIVHTPLLYIVCDISMLSIICNSVLMYLIALHPCSITTSI